MAQWKTTGLVSNKLKSLVKLGVPVSQIIDNINENEFNFKSRKELDSLVEDLYTFSAENSENITGQERGKIYDLAALLASIVVPSQSNKSKTKTVTPKLPKPKAPKPATQKAKPEALPKVSKTVTKPKATVVKKPKTSITKIPTPKRTSKLAKVQEKSKIVAENTNSHEGDLISAINALSQQVSNLSSKLNENLGSIKSEKRTAEQIHQEKMADIRVKQQKEDRLSKKVDSDAAHKRDLEESARKKIELQNRIIAQKAHSDIEKTKRAELTSSASNKRVLEEKYKTKRMYDYLATPEGQKAERYKGLTARKEINAKLKSSEHRLEQAQIRKNIVMAQLLRKDADLAFKKQRNEERKAEKREREEKAIKSKQERLAARKQKELENKRKARVDTIVGAFGKEDAVFGAAARGVSWLHDKARSRTTNKAIQQHHHESSSLVDGMVGGATGNILARGVAALLPAVLTLGGAALIGTIVGAIGAYIWNNKNDLFSVKKSPSSSIIKEKSAQALGGFTNNNPFGSGVKTSDLKSGMQKYTGNGDGFYQEIYNKALIQASNRGMENPETIAHLAASQASLESNYGKRHSGVNNIFGIKNKNGKSTKTKEFMNGKWVTIHDKFANYNSIDDGIGGYLDLLSNKRYKSVIKSKDFNTASNSIRESGYATDPNYSRKLRQIYEKNKLSMAQSTIDTAINTKAGTPVSVNVVGGTSTGGVVNNNTYITHAPDTDPTIKKIGNQHLITNRIQ